MKVSKYATKFVLAITAAMIIAGCSTVGMQGGYRAGSTQTHSSYDSNSSGSGGRH